MTRTRTRFVSPIAVPTLFQHQKSLLPAKKRPSSSSITIGERLRDWSPPLGPAMPPSSDRLLRYGQFHGSKKYIPFFVIALDPPPSFSFPNRTRTRTRPR